MTTPAFTDLYEPETYQQCIARIDALTLDSQPRWGKMSVSQMMVHCAEVFEVTNGTKPLENTPFFIKLIKGFIKRAVFNEKPYSKNSPTHPQYLITDPQEFDLAKQQLLTALETFVKADPAVASEVEHPLFGRVPAAEKSWGMYKHLDHHLSQFGV